MRKFILITYLFGSSITAILLLISLSQSNYVLFPDSVLPMKLYELSSIWLAFGFFPMFFVTILFKKICNRKIIFIPSTICLAFLLFFITILLMSLIKIQH